MGGCRVARLLHECWLLFSLEYDGGWSRILEFSEQLQTVLIFWRCGAAGNGVIRRHTRGPRRDPNAMSGVVFRTGRTVIRRTLAEARAHRSFSTAGAARANDAKDTPGPTPVDYASFSEASVMSRIARRRVRPAAGHGRSRPGRSEEDYWLEAQAPGYEGDTAKTSKRWPVAAPSSPSAAAADAAVAGAAAAATPPAGGGGGAAAVDAATGGPAPHTAATTHSHPSPAAFVRVSSARVREGQSGRLVRLYREEAAPMYAACEGCVGARLLLDEGSASAVSVTEWTAEAASASAARHADYGRVMRALASCFEGAPVVTGASVVVAVGEAS